MGRCVPFGQFRRPFASCSGLNPGDRSVVSFGRRAFVAVVVWLGLAALDLGARAAAAFLPGVSLQQSSDAAWGAGGPGLGAGANVPDEPVEIPNAWPPRDPSTPTEWA